MIPAFRNPEKGRRKGFLGMKTAEFRKGMKAITRKIKKLTKLIVCNPINALK